MAARKTQPEYERLNKSKLAMRFDLDRATVTKRLDANNIKPVETKSRESIYELTPQVAAILSKIDSAMDEAKLRRETANARAAEIKVAQAEGDLVPAVEFRDLTQRIFSAMHKEMAVRAPQRLGGKLARAKTAAQAAKIIKADTDRVFKTLRDDFEGMLK